MLTIKLSLISAGIPEEAIYEQNDGSCKVEVASPVTSPNLGFGLMHFTPATLEAELEIFKTRNLKAVRIIRPSLLSAEPK